MSIQRQRELAAQILADEGEDSRTTHTLDAARELAELVKDELMPKLARELDQLRERAHDAWEELSEAFEGVDHLPEGRAADSQLIQAYIRFRVTQNRILKESEKLILGEELDPDDLTHVVWRAT